MIGTRYRWRVQQRGVDRSDGAASAVKPAIAIAGALLIVAAIVSSVVWLTQSTPSSPSPSAAPTSLPPAVARAGLPDPQLTPGATNPDVTQKSIKATICRKNWARKVRPPAGFTNGLKQRQIGQYGYADTDPKHYEEDHLIPLELGGAPRSAKNLWPEPLSATLSDGASVGAAVKDRLEDDLNQKVCSGTMTLAAAQQSIALDWIAAWNQAGRP
jgi:hypothetical protein